MVIVYDTISIVVRRYECICCRLTDKGYTDLFINNGTLDFVNKIKTIDHISLVLSRIHYHPMPQVSCKFGNDIRRNNATVMIQVKEAKIV